MPNPGAVPANLYQGSRSEYLAQYVFSMFGTATLVPHQEDFGLDLFCTLTKQSGGRAEPYAYYAVQIKSTPDPWDFGNEASVRWILDYPAPLLFCVVNKKAAELTVYHVLSRFQAAILSPMPATLTMLPGQPGTADGAPGGRPRSGFNANGQLELGPPILKFTISDLLDDDKYETFARILDYWITRDLDNVVRRRFGMRIASGPSRYTTNQEPPAGGFARLSMTWMPPEIRQAAGNTAAEHLDWIGEVLRAEGDETGALLAALLIRRLIPGGDPDRTLGFSPNGLYAHVQRLALEVFGVQSTGAVLPDIDAAVSELVRRVNAACQGQQSPPAR